VIGPRQSERQVGAARRLVDLPMLAAPTPSELEAELEQREAELAGLRAAGAGRERTNPIRYHVSWLRRMIAHGDGLAQWRTSRGEVWAARVGDCAVVGAPGEIFSEIGREVRERSPFGTTLFAGYCQGILGYVATPEEHPHGGYEPAVAQRGYDHPAPFAPEAAAMIVDAALDALDELAGRGLRHVLLEGGPSLLGTALAAGVVDEMAMTIAPTVVGGDFPRIVAGPPLAAPDGVALRPHLLVEEAGTLLGLWRVR